MNLAAAYAGLSGPVQRLADRLTAEHTFVAGYQMIASDPGDASVLAMIGPSPRPPSTRSSPSTRRRARKSCT